MTEQDYESLISAIGAGNEREWVDGYVERLIQTLTSYQHLEDWCTVVRHGGESVDAILRDDVLVFIRAAQEKT